MNSSRKSWRQKRRHLFHSRVLEHTPPIPEGHARLYAQTYLLEVAALPSATTSNLQAGRLG